MKLNNSVFPRVLNALVQQRSPPSSFVYMTFRASTPRLFQKTHVTLKSKVKPSSREWLSRQFRDPYVKKRLSDPAAYRSRAAFKLLEIEDSWNFLTRPYVRTVVDLGSAPGGWSQVVAGKLGWGVEPQKLPSGGLDYGEKSKKVIEKRGTWSMPKVKEEDSSFDPLNIDDMDDAANRTGRGTIIAVDLLKMQPIYGVHFIQGDFLAPETTDLVEGMLEAKGDCSRKVDVVLSDIAANMTGNAVTDVEANIQVLNAVWNFAKRHLRTAVKSHHRDSGVLLVKHFAHPSVQDFRNNVLKPHFNMVHYYKPPSSRAESSEGYFLCQGYRGQIPDDTE